MRLITAFVTFAPVWGGGGCRLHYKTVITITHMTICLTLAALASHSWRVGPIFEQPCFKAPDEHVTPQAGDSMRINILGTCEKTAANMYASPLPCLTREEILTQRPPHNII